MSAPNAGQHLLQKAKRRAAPPDSRRTMRARRRRLATERRRAKFIPQTKEADMAGTNSGEQETAQVPDHLPDLQLVKSTDGSNPFSNLDALRCPQDYEEFLGGEANAAFAVRTLKEAMHLRVNPDPIYTLLGQYTAATKQGTYFVYPQFRDALGPLPRRCNLHIAVDGHGEYFLLLVKQTNPKQDDNVWYQTARMVAAAATQSWVKVTKPIGAGWGFIRVQHKMFDPKWPEKPFEELLNAAFPDRVVNKLNHDLIEQFKERGS
jgi:hypothetical protein